MSPAGRSWHIPYVSKYQRLKPDEHLYVAFLQWLSQEEREQVVRSLETVDNDEASRFDVPTPTPRRLVPRPWIRDYWPSSNAILEIGKHANVKERDDEYAYRSIIFIDSGWEAGNVIAAHWEGPEGAQQFNAVRVPMSLANSLLNACDEHEGYTLSRALGYEIFEEAKVDFYKALPPKLPEPPVETGKSFAWPEGLPRNLRLPKDRPYIVTFRELSQSQEDTLRRTIAGSDKAARLRSSAFDIYHCKGSGSSRRAIYHIFKHIYNSSPESDRNMAVFFIDDVLKEANDAPQLLAVIQHRPELDRPEHHRVSTAPIQTENFLPLWKASAASENSEDLEGEGVLEKYGDIWRKEDVHDLELGPVNFRKHLRAGTMA